MFPHDHNTNAQPSAAPVTDQTIFKGLKSPEQLHRVLGALCIVIHAVLVADKLVADLWGLALLEALICILVLVDLEASFRGQRFPIPVAVILALLAIDLPFAIHGLGVQEAYWAFPTIVAFLALGEGRVGLGLSIGLCLVLPVVIFVMGEDLRFLAPLSLSLMLVTAIMWFLKRRMTDLQTVAQSIQVLDQHSSTFSRGYLDFLSESPDLKQVSVILVDWDQNQSSTDNGDHLKALAGLLVAELGGKDLLFRVDDQSLLVVVPRGAAHEMFERAQAFEDITRASSLNAAGRARFGCATRREDEPFWGTVARARDRIRTSKQHGRRRTA